MARGEDRHGYRITQMEIVMTSIKDSRAANNLYKQSMLEAADYEGLAEEAVSDQHAEMAQAYAALASMKYNKAAALKAW